MNNLNRPKLPFWLLRLITNDHQRFPAIGDLEELFLERTKQQDKFIACLWIWKQVLFSLPYFLVQSVTWSLIMLGNYFKITIRNLRCNKFLYAINIFSLVIGLTFCILTFLFIQHEYTYNKFHKDVEQIYRVYSQRETSNRGSFKSTAVPFSFGPAIVEESPGIIDMVRLYTESSDYVVSNGNNSFRERIFFADKFFFQMFTFPLKYGNLENALKLKNSIVLNKPIAKKYFGNENPVGKVLSIKYPRQTELRQFIISDVVENIPENSSIKFDLIVPIKNNNESNSDWSFVTNYTTFVKLQKKLGPKDIRPQIDSIEEKYLTDWSKKYNTKFHLQPITDIYFDTEINAAFYHLSSNPNYSIFLFSIALLVLIIACINFININIARSSKRTLEVGIRKTIGSSRKQLFFQFLSEFLMLILLSLVFSLILAQIFLPLFNELLGASLSITSLLNFKSIILCILFIFILTILSGFYPAIILSSFEPIDIIRNRFKFKGNNIFSRGLIVFQFVLSIFFICCALLMQKQTILFKNTNLGYNAEQVLIISTDVMEKSNLSFMDIFRNNLMQYPMISSISGFSNSFVDDRISTASVERTDNESLRYHAIFADYDFLNTLKIDLLIGRQFSKEHALDATKAVIVNECFVKEMRWNDPIGKILPGQLGFALNDKTGKPNRINDPEVIGVVQDFNFRSLHNKITPLALYLNPSSVGKEIYIRINSRDISEPLRLIEYKWRELTSGLPFKYRFLDEDVEKQYQEETRWTKIISYASGFAILVACLGIFGLSFLSILKRTKEIGVRKVLGATVPNLIFLTSKSFIFLLFLANVFAWPLAYFFIQNWLQDFAYRIDISILTFLFSSFLTLLIALITISFQSIKTAIANPINSLRYE